MKKGFIIGCLFIFLFGFANLLFAQIKSGKNNKEIQKQVSSNRDGFANRVQNPLFTSQIASTIWTLNHDYSDYEKSDEVLKTFLTYLEAFEKDKNGNAKELTDLGGEKGLKDKLVGWLKEDDQAIRAFSALMLGVGGDQKYAPQVALLLKKKQYKETDSIHYDRGRAAMALGMMDAKQYTQELIKLLKSKNEFDRAGALYGLGYLKTKDKINLVKGFLKDEDESVRQAAANSLKLIDIK